MKTCNRCHEVKALSEFEKAKTCTDGRRGACRTCTNVDNAKRAAAWRAKNPQRAKEIDAKYKLAHPEKIIETRAAYYKRNAESQRKVSAEYYAANTEKCIQATRRWVENNREARRISTAAWKAANAESINAYNAKWDLENPAARRLINQNRRARILGNASKLSKGLAEKLFVAQRGKCACCGAPLGEDYHLDHRVPLSRGGAHEDGNMQLLKKKCNLQKKDRDPLEFMRSRGFLL